MPFFESGDLRVAIDDKGYLTDFDSWTREIAVALARTEKIEELTPAHWGVIEFLRRYQAEHGVAPMIRVLCRETGLKLQEIYELFPNGPAKGACRVAGLPRPDSCV
jgi:tRNA 2-thiouridine synthesizing protein E